MKDELTEESDVTALRAPEPVRTPEPVVISFFVIVTDLGENSVGIVCLRHVAILKDALEPR